METDITRKEVSVKALEGKLKGLTGENITLRTDKKVLVKINAEFAKKLGDGYIGRGTYSDILAKFIPKLYLRIAYGVD